MDFLAGIPTIPSNEYIDTARVIVSIWSGMILLPMLLVAWRTKNYGFYALAIYVFLTSVSEADQVGNDFVVYQLPLRAIGIAIATYWMWKRRRSSTA